MNFSSSMMYRFTLRPEFAILEKPKKKAPEVDRSFWLVKDEAYNARKAEGKIIFHIAIF